MVMRPLRDGPVRDLNETSVPRPRTVSPARVAWFALALASVTAGSAGVWAQGHGQMGPRAAPPGMVPPPGMMPGMQPGMMPGQTGGPPKFVPGMANPNATGPVQEMKAPDPVKLPPNYAPPGDRDPLMDIDRPLVAPDELEKLKKDFNRYGTLLRTARSTDPDKAVIRNGLRYRLALMCQKEARAAASSKEATNVKDISKLHEDLLRDLASAAAAPDSSKPADAKAFRQFVMQEIVNQVTPLLSTQNFYVRLHMVILLGELNLTEDHAKLALKQEAFYPAAEPLVGVITDAKQPEAIKVAAVNGLVRLMRQGNAPVLVRMKVAEGIVGELKNKSAHRWYQMRLAGALAAIDVDLDQARTPFVVDVLKSVLADDERDWSVRAEAAKSLGRVTIPATVNPQTVTRSVAEFALKLAKAAQQAPQQKADDPRWKAEFIKLYLAFQPVDATDTMANKTSKAGLLNNSAAASKPAYDLIVPLVAAVLHGQRLTVQQVNSLESWVGPTPTANNKPAQPANAARGVSVEAKGTESAPASVNASGPK